MEQFNNIYQEADQKATHYSHTMMTVEEFLEKHNLPETLSGGTLKWAMIEFAKEMEKEKKTISNW